MSTAETIDLTTEGDPVFSMGNRIAKRRHDIGYDQSELASIVGVSRPLISKWERDVSVPDVVQARRLSDALNCSFGWLCGVPARSRCSSETGRSERHLHAVPDILDGWAVMGDEVYEQPHLFDFAT